MDDCFRYATDCLNAFSSICPELPIDSNKGRESVNNLTFIFTFNNCCNSFAICTPSSINLNNTLVSAAFGDTHTFLITPGLQYIGAALYVTIIHIAKINQYKFYNS